MDHSPPPFFKQGPSYQARLFFFVLLSCALLLLDARYKALTTVRQGVALILYPVQQALLIPRDALRRAGEYFDGLTVAQRENEALRRRQIEGAQLNTQAQQLAAENAQLRRLLAAKERTAVPSVLGEVLYEARDAFSHRLVLDKGSFQGVLPGQPVIDDGGVVGQVTRVTQLTAEVSLLTDRDQMIPVQVLRNGIRAIAFGGETPGRLGLRFMAANADIQEKDILVTSGIDGIYPPGLPVATVEKVERDAAYGFAKIICQPSAGLERYRHFLVLLVVQPELPVLQPPETTGSHSKGSKR